MVSCVGQETEFTIADFVADRRAPTPSAAAELATPDRRDLLERTEGLSEGMVGLIEDRLRDLSERLERARAHPLLQSPHRLYEERIKRVDELSGRVGEALRQILLHAEKDLQLQAEKLDAFSPLKVLARGCMIAERWPSHEILRSAAQVRPGDKIRIRLHEGEIHCEVTDDKNSQERSV